MDILSREQLYTLPIRVETTVAGIGDFTSIDQSGFGLFTINIAAPTDVNTATATDVTVDTQVCVLSIC